MTRTRTLQKKSDKKGEPTKKLEPEEGEAPRGKRRGPRSRRGLEGRDRSMQGIVIENGKGKSLKAGSKGPRKDQMLSM